MSSNVSSTSDLGATQPAAELDADGARHDFYDDAAVRLGAAAARVEADPIAPASTGGPATTTPSALPSESSSEPKLALTSSRESAAVRVGGPDGLAVRAVARPRASCAPPARCTQWSLSSTQSRCVVVMSVG